MKKRDLQWEVLREFMTTIKFLHHQILTCHFSNLLVVRFPGLLTNKKHLQRILLARSRIKIVESH